MRILSAILFAATFIISGCTHRVIPIEPVAPQIVPMERFDTLQDAEPTPELSLTVQFTNNGQSILPSSDIHNGDLLKIEVTIPKDGYGYMFNVGPVGDVNALWPSDVEPYNNVYAGQVWTLGPFDVMEPLGEEQIVIFFSPTPMANKQIMAKVMSELALSLGFNAMEGKIEEWQQDVAPRTRGVSMTRGVSRGMELVFDLSDPDKLHLAQFGFTSSP